MARTKTRNRKKQPRFPRHSLAHDERGLFAVVSAALMVAIFLGIATVMSLALPILARSMADATEANVILIHVPLFGQTSAGEAIAPGFTSKVDGGLGSYAPMSQTMADIYISMRNIGLGIIIVAFLFAGFAYMFEHVRILPEGLTAQIFHESVFILILLFIFPLLWNIGAAAVNGVSENVIMNGRMQDNVRYVVSAAAAVPGREGWKADQGVIGQLSGTFTAPFTTALSALIFSGFSIITIMITVVMGVGRLFFLGVLVAMFPILLGLRLIPMTRGIAENLQRIVIGLMLISIFVAGIFKFASNVLVGMHFDPNAGQFSTWLLGIASLSVAAGMAAILAPGIGRIAAQIGRGVAGAVAAPVGGMVAASAAPGLRGATGMAAGTLAGVGASVIDKARGFGAAKSLIPAMAAGGATGFASKGVMGMVQGITSSRQNALADFIAKNYGGGDHRSALSNYEAEGQKLWEDKAGLRELELEGDLVEMTAGYAKAGNWQKFFKQHALPKEDEAKLMMRGKMGTGYAHKSSQEALAIIRRQDPQFDSRQSQELHSFAASLDRKYEHSLPKKELYKLAKSPEKLIQNERVVKAIAPMAKYGRGLVFQKPEPAATRREHRGGRQAI